MGLVTRSLASWRVAFCCHIAADIFVPGSARGLEVGLVLLEKPLKGKRKEAVF